MEKTQTHSAPEAVVRSAPVYEAAHDAAHGPTVNVYYTIFGCLFVLTGVTVFVSQVHLPPVAAVVIAFLIAIGKATLVVAFFMHLKYDPKVLRVMCLVPVVLTMIALMALMPDIGMSGPQAAGPSEVAQQVLADYEAAGPAGHHDEHAAAGDEHASDTQEGGGEDASNEASAEEGQQEESASH